jgi:lysozyme family protein
MFAHNVIDDIIRREGDTYTDDPADRGGPTKYGITLALLRRLRPDATAADVQRLTEQEARDVYRTEFVLPFDRFRAYPDLLALCVDSAVQHGVSRVQGWLKLIPSSDPDVNYISLFKRRMVFYGEIVQADSSQSRFIKGWLARLSEFAR